eukprot:TRINITY_DN110293_c0_g1_i1.p1 TRINITY_DN110293_c0_g1~~TRINITY_DN110293_c0_g1_i1.p1  ORF type:complete len:701 (+),score=143.77 TRINITY_DN110293_c0_g1_i1:23-2125(+)
MAPVQRKSSRGDAVASTPSAASSRRRGTATVDEEDDDALLARESKSCWTDAFIVLKVSRWAVCKVLELHGARTGGAAVSATSSRIAGAGGKKRAVDEAEELPLKEAVLQFIGMHKVPVGLLAIFIFTCALTIGGENVDRYGEMPREAAEDHYGVMGVARDADTADIKRAYKTLAKRWHPDRNPDCSSCQETFSKIAVAYETLSDETSRAVYDESGGVASSELKSPKSVPLTRENFDELVTFSNDVWIVQVFRPDNGQCATFHPFWENQIQKYGHLVRFGRIDMTNDQAKWLPMRVRVLPTVLKFGRHLGSVDIFPVTQMHETPQALMKFVLTSFPNIGLPLHADKQALPNWMGASTRRHKVLFAIPGKSEEERYKSHLVPRKLAAKWSEIFEMRTADTAVLHDMPLPPEVAAALPSRNESGQKGALLFFPARGSKAPAASALFEWPTGEEEIVLELLRLTEIAAPSLSAQSADLLCKSLAIRRVYCLVLLDAPDAALGRAVRELRESRAQYTKEVAEIRASGGEVSEDEDNFVVQPVRLLRHPSGVQPSVASCYAPKFPQVEKALGGSSAFLMDLDTGRLAALKGTSSFRGLYPQLAYEDSLIWVDKVLDMQSLPDCSEGVQRRFARQLQKSSPSELFWLLLFALFFMEVLAKALSSETLSWWLGAICMMSVVLLRSPPVQRWLVEMLPGSLFPADLLKI